jgi:zinc-finger binding domain of transposase IS66
LTARCRGGCDLFPGPDLEATVAVRLRSSPSCARQRRAGPADRHTADADGRAGAPARQGLLELTPAAVLRLPGQARTGAAAGCRAGRAAPAWQAARRARRPSGPVAQPDELAWHVPDRCSGCGEELTSAPVTGVETRQVFDLPPMRLGVVEHRARAALLPCGATTAGVFPRRHAPPPATSPGCGRWCAISWTSPREVDTADLRLQDSRYAPRSRCRQRRVVGSYTA